MKRKKETLPPVSKTKLLSALENTYDDSRFLVSQRLDEDGDFFKGLCLNRSAFWSRSELMGFVKRSPLEECSGMPEFPDHLVLSSDIYVWRESVNHNQVYLTDPPAGYHHVAGRGTPHYDMYFQIDHEEKTISFCLGTLSRTLLLAEYTDYCWKPTKTHICCGTSKWLEHEFLDPFWSDTAVYVARQVLGVKPAI